MAALVGVFMQETRSMSPRRTLRCAERAVGDLAPIVLQLFTTIPWVRLANAPLPVMLCTSQSSSNYENVWVTHMSISRLYRSGTHPG